MVRLTRFCTGLFACVAAILSAPAVAQYGPPPPPRQDLPQGNVPQPNAPPPAAASGTEVLRAAGCVIGRDADDAAALLSTAPFTSQERDRAARLLRSAERCLRLRQPIAASVLVFRGAVAEALYESRFAQPASARTPAAAAAPFFEAANLAGREDAVALGTHFDVGQCTAPRHPDLVRALLATEPGSDVEMTALQALYPGFGSCVNQGTRLGIDRVVMRAVLAEALYRWSTVQQDPSSPWAAPAAAAAAN